MHIYRIFECQHGVLNQLVFMNNLESVKNYLISCYTHNTDNNTFYFVQQIQIEN